MKIAAWFRKIILIAHLLLIGVIVLSWYAPNIPPKTNTYIAFVGMAFPYLMLVNILTTVYWAILKKWPALIGLACLFCFWGTTTRFFQFSSHSEKHDLKVLSFNTRAFNKYGWRPNKNTTMEIADFLKESEADIYCFQEFYDLPESDKFRTTKTVQKSTQSKAYFLENFYREHRELGKRFFGLAIFTKHQIIAADVVFKYKKEKKARAIYADIKVNNDTIRVYNLHLRSINFHPNDYKFLKDVTDGTSEQQLKSSQKIIQKLKRSFSIRAIEAENIKKHIEKSPHPVLVIGDFNEVPNNYSYALVSQHLKDGFIEKGKGFGFSYSGLGSVLKQRIDYILADPKFDFQSFTTHSSINLSDHKPISATLNLKL